MRLIRPSGSPALPWDWTTPTPLTPPDISPDDHRAAAWLSEPFPDALLITGRPTITVVLRSDRPDVPVRAWLSDVRPTVRRRSSPTAGSAPPM
jgi:predicted acyl esterase